MGSNNRRIPADKKMEIVLEGLEADNSASVLMVAQADLNVFGFKNVQFTLCTDEEASLRWFVGDDTSQS